MDPHCRIPPAFRQILYTVQYMAANSKWTPEEDSILVEAVSSGTSCVVVSSEAYSTYEYQPDRGFVRIQSPKGFQEGATSLAANGGFIRWILLFVKVRGARPLSS